ncbi:MAG: hypothetical protein IJ511_09980 [Bacteroides sp.]|nr:hypothetical protein [Bacteroides sp.]
MRLNESELSIRRTENALRLASMNLCHYIGRPLTTEIAVEGTLPEVPEDIQMQTSDITARPEYGILEKQSALARQQVKLSRSEMLPVWRPSATIWRPNCCGSKPMKRRWKPASGSI